MPKRNDELIVDRGWIAEAATRLEIAEKRVPRHTQAGTRFHGRAYLWVRHIVVTTVSDVRTLPSEDGVCGEHQSQPSRGPAGSAAARLLLGGTSGACWKALISGMANHVVAI
jgi:hypothetical protein